jgi:ABC-type sugar transport system ATPase subunit
VLRLGKRVATFRTAETTQDEVVAAITGARSNGGGGTPPAGAPA